MRLQSLRLISFGAFQERGIEFAPGLNVIFGPNESGKSTCHAAVYAALCGLRRGAGRAKDDREFEDRHRPWDGSGWAVSAVLELAGGRVVEIRQDLDRKIDSQVMDLGLGRDVSGEILSDGAPDASRWAGLDRRTFLATACIRQAEIMEVTKNSALLGEHLQRAAATAGTDGTAAAALARIEDFRKQRIGRDRAGSSRPLRHAIEARQAARQRLGAAQQEHARYLDLALELEQAKTREVGLTTERDAHRARLAEELARELARRHEQARLLADRYPAPPPTTPTADHRSGDSDTITEESQLLAGREAAAQARRRARVWLPGLPALVTTAGLAGAALIDLVTGSGALAALVAAMALLVGGAVYISGSGRVRQIEAERQRLERALEDARRQSEQRDRIHGQWRAHVEAWGQLQLLLAGGTLPNLAARAEQAQTDARERAWGRDEHLSPPERGRAEVEARLDELDQELREAHRHSAQIRGSLEETGRGLPSVAEAQDDLAQSEAELTRIEDLARILDQAQSFLEKAQDRVHRDVAPVLAGRLQHWLPSFTEERYEEATVDPETLEVRVRGRHHDWRKANLLSHGTREQIYLLLRLALVEHLTQSGETCPLLLDEVTVHSDRDRTARVLEIMRHASQSQQVLLFTQEDRVADWARQAMSPPHDRLIEIGS